MFGKTLAVLHTARALKKTRGGRPHTVSVENMLVTAPEYPREYRAYFHTGGGYAISESYAYRLIRRVEDTLIQPGGSLPGKKEPLTGDAEYGVVLAGATETPVERPKRGKSADSGWPGKPADYPYRVCLRETARFRAV